MILSRSLAFSLTLAFVSFSCGRSGGSTGIGAGALAGSVSSPSNPSSGVNVIVIGAGGTSTSTTANDGSFEVTDLAPGTYTVMLDGAGVFDPLGNPIPDKIDFAAGNVVVGEGATPLSDRPIFMPEKAIGTFVDTSGSNSVVIPSGFVVSNSDLGVSLVFEANTTATFESPDDTSVSITQIPLEHIPVPLPSGVSADSVFTVQPLGMAFNIPPKAVFPNATGIPAGTPNVSLFELNEDSGQWTEFGTGTVSADASTIISDPGEGISGSGWFTATVDTFCSTTVTGNVQDSLANGIPNVLVSTINGATATTDMNGDYSIADVPLPSNSYNVVASALPAKGSGFMANAAAPVMGICGGATNIADIVLTAVAIDTTAPTIVATQPSNGATGITDSSVISVTFSEVISRGSLNANTFVVASGGARIPGVIAFTPMGMQSVLTFVPSTLLPVDSEISITLTTGVLDGSGNPLELGFTVFFQTSAATSGGSPTVDALPDGPISLDPGMTQQLTVNVLDASGNPVPNPLVSWRSDNPTVATIDATGNVTALLPGMATITSKFGLATDTSVVTVNTPVPAQVVITPGNLSIVTGAVQQLSAEAFDAVPSLLSGVIFTWTSTMPGVATVDASGTVTAVGPGTTTIRATEPGSVFGTATVTVSATIDSVSVTPDPLQVGVGASSQLTAVALDPGQAPIGGASFVWETTNDAVATVNGAGLVTGVAPGMATISATATGTAVAGESDVTIFVDTSLVATLQGGNRESDTLAGVRIFRNDPATGALLGEVTTNGSGVADFGMTGTSRTTLTALVDNIAGEMEAKLVTFHNIEVGVLTLNLNDAAESAEFDMQVNGVPIGSERAYAFDSAYSENTNAAGSGVLATITAEDIAVSELQSNGLVSYVVATENSVLGIPTAAAFVLDQDPAVIDGTTVMATVTPANLTTVPFTANQATSPTGGRVQRNGSQFHLAFTPLVIPLAIGNAFLAVPPGSNRLSFQFDNSTGPVDTTRELFFNAAPGTLNVVVPDLDIPTLARNGATGEITWSLNGTDAANVDYFHLTSFYRDGSSNLIQWEAFLDKSVTAFTPPQLPGNLASLVPPQDGVGFTLEATGLDIVTDLDSLMVAAQAVNGNLDKLALTSANDRISASRGFAAMLFSIGGAGAGSVSLDLGVGPGGVNDGDWELIPVGSSLTIIATGNLGVFVTQMDCPFLPPLVVPLPIVQCLFGLAVSSSFEVTIAFN